MAENILDRFKDTKTDSFIDTSKKIRVGIIGTGWIDEAHVAAYLNQPDVEIVAAADLVEGKAEAFFANYGMEVIDSGVAVLNMHAPWEIISKVDLYEAYKGYVAFLSEA